MHGFLGFLSTMILLLAMVNYAHADTGWDDAEGLRAGVVLQAGEIDSRMVEVGALAVVVYGMGERHPVSGEWAKLDTARGYIKAVYQRRLIVGLELDGWSKSISSERIQTLTLIGSGREEVSSSHTRNMFQEESDNLSTRTAKEEDRETGKRIAKKLGSGILTGTVSGYALATILVGDGFGQEGDGLGEAAATLYGALIGYTAGTAVGVTLVDPHDRFIMSLTGSLTGMWVGIKADELSRGWSVLVCPVAFATIMSELWRDPLKGDRFSIGLRSDCRGFFSAIATLHF